MSNLTMNNSNLSRESIEMTEKLMKLAEYIAKSDMIPSDYRNKPANVFIALQTAYRRNLDPIMVMQNTFKDKRRDEPGIKAQFVITLANNSGLLESGISYKIEGVEKDLKVTASATIKGSGKEISYTISMREADAEGWTKNSKYQTLPELMLRYRAATLLIRTHIPEVMGGMYTIEELDDIAHVKEIKEFTYRTQSLSDRLDQVVAERYSIQTDNIPAVISEEESTTISASTTCNMSSKHEELISLVEINHVPEETISKWCEKAGVRSLDELDENRTISCIEFIKSKYVNGGSLANYVDSD